MNVLFAIILTFEISDGLLTYWAVNSGLVNEWNSIVSQITGNVLFPVLKIFGGIVSVLALWAVSKRFPKIGAIVTSGVFVFYAAVITWNLHILFFSNLT